jgi:hypothetical protein
LVSIFLINKLKEFLEYLASCLIIMQICSSMTIDDQYSPLMEIDNNDEQERAPIDDQLSAERRSAHFIFPPSSFNYPTNRVNDYRDFHPTKRQSFGRKHHWDAFFGRR